MGTKKQEKNWAKIQEREAGTINEKLRQKRQEERQEKFIPHDLFLCFFSCYANWCYYNINNWQTLLFVNMTKEIM